MVVLRRRRHTARPVDNATYNHLLTGSASVIRSLPHANGSTLPHESSRQQTILSPPMPAAAPTAERTPNTTSVRGLCGALAQFGQREQVSLYSMLWCAEIRSRGSGCRDHASAVRVGIRRREALYVHRRHARSRGALTRLFGAGAPSGGGAAPIVIGCDWK